MDIVFLKERSRERERENLAAVLPTYRMLHTCIDVGKPEISCGIKSVIIINDESDASSCSYGVNNFLRPPLLVQYLASLSSLITPSSPIHLSGAIFSSYFSLSHTLSFGRNLVNDYDLTMRYSYKRMSLISSA